MPSLEKPTRLDELGAVNFMLRNIGEDPVSLLGPTAKPTAQKAKEMLAEENINAQSQGWNFCEDRNLKLSPGANGEVLLPSNILSFLPVGYSQFMVLQDDGGKLYDAENSTYKFSSPVYLRAVLAKPFARLPQPAIWYITLAAAFRLATSENPASQALRVTSTDVQQALINLKKYDSRLVRGGMRAHNPFIQRMRGNR